MDSSEMVVSHTLALSLGHIAKLRDLAIRTGKNRSELAREALDDLYAKYADDDVTAEAVGNVVNPHIAPTD
jgi:predicted urease superfamily metal-dependent hydrolase